MKKWWPTIDGCSLFSFFFSWSCPVDRTGLDRWKNTMSNLAIYHHRVTNYQPTPATTKAKNEKDGESWTISVCHYHLSVFFVVVVVVCSDDDDDYFFLPIDNHRLSINSIYISWWLQSGQWLKIWTNWCSTKKRILSFFSFIFLLFYFFCS